MALPKTKPIVCVKCKKKTKNNEEVDTWPWIRYESLSRQLEADLCFEHGNELLKWLGIEEAK